MAKLSMGANPQKIQVNNSTARPVGKEVFIEQITKAEPFESLYAIKPENLAAIKADMAANGFDPSKPVNIWKREDGTRILVDGYTRLRAAGELQLLSVTAYEMSFADEATALEYAIHTQRDRRNLSDADLFGLVEKVDKPQAGFRVSRSHNVAESNAKATSTAEITAEMVGASSRQVEKIRAVLKDPEETAAVRRGEKSINKAEKDARRKRKEGEGSRSTTRPPSKGTEFDDLSEVVRKLIMASLQQQLSSAAILTEAVSLLHQNRHLTVTEFESLKELIDTSNGKAI